jgi:nucleotide-binding universal stress UspA family protein
MYKRIFVPVDGSETSARGLKEALKLARRPGARMRLLHVIDESVLALTPEMGVVDISGALIEEGRKTLKKARALAERHRIKTDTVMPENFSGRIADVILNEARKWRADVIVMGTHGRRGLSHVLLGSAAEGVVRDATVPVLLVRGKAAKAPSPRSGKRG